jgi:hypothetical protein
MKGDAVDARALVQHQIRKPIELKRRCQRRETLQQIRRSSAKQQSKLNALVQTGLRGSGRIECVLKRHYVPLVASRLIDRDQDFGNSLEALPRARY